eukprot:10147376-Lingulodinium_polyedra.AAC.1
MADMGEVVEEPFGKGAGRPVEYKGLQEARALCLQERRRLRSSAQGATSEQLEAVEKALKQVTKLAKSRRR